MEKQRPLQRKFRRMPPERWGWAGNFIRNAVQFRFSKNKFFRSMLPSLYVTLRCNLRCSYCHYHQIRQPELDTGGMYKLLEKMRPKSPALNITGGEPLIREDIIDILRKAKELKFSPIVLNTNALFLDKKEECLSYVDYVIISLDSVDERKWGKILGFDNAPKKIKENIARYAKMQKSRGFRIGINTVITPESIPDFYDVLKFCEDLGLPLSPVPQDDGRMPHKDLVSNPQYRALIKDIIRLKKQGRNIVASDLFLKQILGFPEHNCYPSQVPRVFPDGSVYYPCQPLGKTCGKLQDYPGSLYDMIKEQHKKQGLPPCARNSKNCFMSCYLEFVNLTEHPLSAFKEHLIKMK